MQRFFLLAVCLLSTLSIHAQSFTVTGKVIDNTGLEVIGANISIKGSAGVGTITNIDGQYTLNVNNPAKDVLVISYIGMKTQEIAIKGQKQINVTLQEDSKVLDEVVVIGYGTAKRGDLTGSVVSVKNEDLMQTPTSDVAQAWQGAWQACKSCKAKANREHLSLFVCVAVSPLPKATNRFISLTVFPAKTA